MKSWFEALRARLEDPDWLPKTTPIDAPLPPLPPPAAAEAEAVAVAVAVKVAVEAPAFASAASTATLKSAAVTHAASGDAAELKVRERLQAKQIFDVPTARNADSDSNEDVAVPVKDDREEMKQPRKIKRNGITPANEAHLWKKATSQKGRVYYYHTISRLVQWDKPWKETITKDTERTYYYHPITRETVWELPPDARFTPKVSKESGLYGTGAAAKAAPKDHAAGVKAATVSAEPAAAVAAALKTFKPTKESLSLVPSNATREEIAVEDRFSAAHDAYEVGLDQETLDKASTVGVAAKSKPPPLPPPSSAPPPPPSTSPPPSPWSTGAITIAAEDPFRIRT